jgi:5'-deoxynucleotidase YfbR-like HD superfamily hydrolase
MTDQSKPPTMQRIAELQQFIADFAKVLRVPQLADTGRAENDVEHSFGLALTCWFLAPKIAPDLNLEKILKYAIAHDTVEIHAGDTFVFGEKKQLESKAARENQAVDKLKSDWGDFSELSNYAVAYIHKADEEAKFVYAVDKILPVLMVNLGEKQEFWNRHKISYQMQAEEKGDKMRVSAAVAPYYEQLLEWMGDPDYFYNSASKSSPASDFVSK